MNFFVFFVLFVGVFGGCVTTFWFVFLSLFCFLFDLLFALGCGCRIFHVAAVADAMLGKLWCGLPQVDALKEDATRFQLFRERDSVNPFVRFVVLVAEQFCSSGRAKSSFA